MLATLFWVPAALGRKAKVLYLPSVFTSPAALSIPEHLSSVGNQTSKFSWHVTEWPLAFGGKALTPPPLRRQPQLPS